MTTCLRRFVQIFPKSIHTSQMHRSLSQSSVLNAKSLTYNDYGEPAKVLKLVESQDAKPTENQVVVKWLLAPINPADINTIQGKYPSRPSLPAVGGNEGVGEIVQVGSAVRNFTVGDRVVPNASNIGTWTTYGTYSDDSLLKIPQHIGLVEASMLNVNPCTAYRMLKDYVSLKPGDTVIQNGGNSAVGQLVIQLCKIWKLNSVNVVRDRPDIAELKAHLKNLGSTETLTETELRTTDLFKSKKLPAPALALNCVCGQSGVEVLRHLTHGGTMVTYGAMSREPLTVPASALIFKNVTIKGFWMTLWTKANSDAPERMSMLNELGQMFKAKQLQAPPHKLVPLSDYHEAVSSALNMEGKIGVKFILDMSS